MTVANLKTQLEIIKTQRDKLQSQRHTQAYAQANLVYVTLNQTVEVFDKSELTQFEFDETCNNAKQVIKNAHKVLDEHRGWKKILLNLASIITTILSIGFFNWYTGRKWLFSTQTNSELMLNNVEHFYEAGKEEARKKIKTSSAEDPFSSEDDSDEEPLKEEPSRKPLLLTPSPSPTIVTVRPTSPKPIEVFEEPVASVSSPVASSAASRKQPIATPHSPLPLAPEPQNDAPQQVEQAIVKPITTPMPLTRANTIKDLGKTIIGTPAKTFIEPLTEITQFIRTVASFVGLPAPNDDATSSKINSALTETAQVSLKVAQHTGIYLASTALSLAQIPVVRFYDWNPHEQEVATIVSNFERGLTVFNSTSQLVMKAAKYAQIDYFGNFPINQFTLDAALVQSPQFKQSINVVAILRDMANINLGLPVQLYNNAHYTKLLRDLNFMYLGHGFDWLHFAANSGFLLMSADASIKLVKGGLDLYKNRSLLEKPAEVVTDVVKGFLKSSGPWPAENFELRNNAYKILNNALLGEGSTFSQFELRMQNLFYNIVVSGGTSSGSSMAKLGQVAYLPGHKAYSWLNNASNAYNWYPQLFQSLSAVLPSALTSVVDAQLNSMFDPFTQSVMSHLINKVIWDECIKPLFLVMPVQGLASSGLRFIAETHINNPKFILTFREAVKEALKSLYNPEELLECENFEPSVNLNGQIADAVELVRDVVDLIPSKALGAENAQQFSPVLLKPIYSGCNPITNAILFFTHKSYKMDVGNDDSLLDVMGARIEEQLNIPNFSAFTKGKLQKSTLEWFVTSPVVSCIAGTSSYVKKLYTNEFTAMLATINNAQTLRDLPSVEEIDNFYLVQDQKGRRYQAKVNEVRSAYEIKYNLLQANIHNAVQQTQALYAEFKKLARTINSSSPYQEVPLEYTQNIAVFRTSIEELITLYAKDSEASKKTKLLSTLPDTLMQLIIEKNTEYLNNIRLGLFLKVVINPNFQSLDLAQIKSSVRIEIEKIERENSVSDSIKALIDADMEALKALQPNEFTTYIDNMLKISRQIYEISKIIKFEEKLQALSHQKFLDLLKVADEANNAFELLSTPACDFLQAIGHKTQQSLNLITKDFQHVTYQLKAIDNEFAGLDEMFSELADSKHLSMPTDKQFEEYSILMKPRISNAEELPLVAEYRISKLAAKNKTILQVFILNKLHIICHASKQELAQLVSQNEASLSIINDKIAQIKALTENIAAKVGIDFTDQLQEFATDLHSIFNASSEIAGTISDLQTYLAKVNSTQALMVKPWLKSWEFSLPSGERNAIVTRTNELLKPYLKYHKSECNSVLQGFGLEINLTDNDDEESIHAQLQIAVTLFVKSQVKKLIDDQIISFIHSLKSTKDTDDVVTLCINFVTTHCVKSESVALFTNREEIDNYIKEKTAESMIPFIHEKMTAFSQRINSNLAKLNAQLELKEVAGFFGTGIGATKPLSRAEYDESVDALKAQINIFQPADKRAEILQKFDVLVKPLVVVVHAQEPENKAPMDSEEIKRSGPSSN